MSTTATPYFQTPARQILRRQSGFTLVELMITTAILALLLGIGVPSFNAFILSHSLATQTNELVTAITIARSEAIKRNRTVTFCRAVSAEAESCATQGRWQHWILLDDNGDVIRRGSLKGSPNLRVTSNLPQDSLSLSSDGLARTTVGNLAAAESINVCAESGAPDNQREITLGAGNRTSIVKQTGECP